MRAQYSQVSDAKSSNLSWANISPSAKACPIPEQMRAEELYDREIACRGADLGSDSAQFTARQ
jgi:hypothetical protein